MIYSCYSLTHTRSHTWANTGTHSRGLVFPWRGIKLIGSENKKKTRCRSSHLHQMCATLTNTHSFGGIFHIFSVSQPNANVKNYDKNICFTSCRADKWLCLIFRLFVLWSILGKNGRSQFGPKWADFPFAPDEVEFYGFALILRRY